MRNLFGPKFLFVLLLLAGCARAEKFQALEGTKDIPYDSLGTVEVKKRVLVFSASGASPAAIKESLRAALAQKARKHYGADSVIKVRYWPDPASRGFPHGLIYARGEMIRYRHFPAESPEHAV